MVEKQPLLSMVLRWFLVYKPLIPMAFGPTTIGFPMVLEFGNHWTQMVFQWFPMVANHWSNDGMVKNRSIVGVTVKSANFNNKFSHCRVLLTHLRVDFGAFGLFGVSTVSTSSTSSTVSTVSTISTVFTVLLTHLWFG